jgi:ribosome biogenesis GTPase
LTSDVQDHVFLVAQCLNNQRPERNLSGLSNFTFHRKRLDHSVCVGYPFLGKVAMIRYSLEQLGWNGTFAEVMAPFYKQGLVPARVIAEHRGLYRIAGTAGEMPAEVTGRLMFQAEERLDYPVVGDWVATAVYDQGERAVIRSILPRASVLARKHAGRKIEGQAIAANIDIIFIVIGLDHNFNLNRVERYLAVASGSGARSIVILSKSDLAADSEGRAAEVRSRTDNAAVIAASARTGSGLEGIRELLNGGRTGCFIGSSGVGKSSLINRLAGSELLRTSEVRSADSRGRHTTSHRELFVLDSGGIVIDTPGMRELGIWDSREGIERAFADIEQLAAGCAFRDCTHRIEPECAVRAAVDAGELEPARYENFLKLGREQEHLEARTDRFKQQEKKAYDKALSKAVKDVSKRKGREGR